MNSEVRQKLLKILRRNQRKSEYYQQKYTGKESSHTFYGGWNLGYWEGRVTAFEELLDMLEECDCAEDDLTVGQRIKVIFTDNRED